MTYALANVEGRATLVSGDHWYDLAVVSNGELGADPMAALAGPDRAVQFAAQPPHFDLGKSFATFGPLGPVMISPDSVERDRLRIVTEVNGELRQDATTDQMIFDVPTLVSYLSRVTTLATGDLIFTGTPDGIGITQGKVLADGDVITTRMDGIGTLTNRCIRVGDHRVC